MRAPIRNVNAARATLALVIALGLSAAGCAPAKVFITPVITPSPPPTPTPTIDPFADEAQAAKAAFASLVAKPGLSYHLEQELTVVQQGGQAADYASVLDVNGKDVKATLSVGGTTSDLVIIDHATWVRQHGGKWQRGRNVDNGTIKDITDPLQHLRPMDQLAYVGRVDGTPERYRFRNTGPIPYETLVTDLAGLPGTIDALEIVLEADGTPVEYEFHGSIRPTSGGMAAMAFDLTSRVALSRVGKPVTIKRPK